MTLRAYSVTLVSGTAHPHDHRALRWVTAEELPELDWVHVDTAWLADLEAVLNS
jgi:8-oxo-dGTP diphosphatase